MATPFSIRFEQKATDDLKSRLAATRWPDAPEKTSWEYGSNSAYMKSLCEHWRQDFDFRAQEEVLNRLRHFTTVVDGYCLHFIREQGRGKRCVPLLLIHGWPDSFVRFLKLMPLLTAPDGEGLCFDLVVPSIPGFGYSGSAMEPGMNPEKVAGLFAGLMRELGHDQFLVHGGDWGSSIGEMLGLYHSDRLLGLHLTDVPYHHLFTIAPDDLSDAEKDYLKKGQQWQQQEGGYAILQSTKPQTLAYGLNDSPAGLAAWIVEKFQRWSDCGNSLENCYSKDELLLNLSVYWFTQTINSANRMYYEALHHPPRDARAKVEVPTGVALFPKDLIPAPEAFVRRFFNLKQWTPMPRGGHFAALEQPELLAEDLRRFARLLAKAD